MPQSQSDDAIGEPWDIEVDEQTDRNIEQLQIAQQLGLMDWKNAFHRFYFDQHAILHQHIAAKRIFAIETFLANRDDTLRLGRKAMKSQFAHESPLVN